MARTFNYQRATIAEVALHILTVQRQTYLKTLRYYSDKGYSDVVEKLEQAYKINLRNELIAALEAAQ